MNRTKTLFATPPGHRDRGDSARLSNGDNSRFGVASSVENLRELSALSRTGLSDYDNHRILFYCFYDLLFELEDWKIYHHH